MIVRPATEADIPRIVEMSQHFYDTTLYAKLCPMTPECAAGLAIITMDRERGVMLVAQDDDDSIVGMVCLFIDQFTFNITVTIANELVYWIEPQARGGMLAARFLKSIESECRARGVGWIQMATLPDSPPQAAHLYDRFGYIPSGSLFAKVLA